MYRVVPQMRSILLISPTCSGQNRVTGTIIVASVAFSQEMPSRRCSCHTSLPIVAIADNICIQVNAKLDAPTTSAEARRTWGASIAHDITTGVLPSLPGITGTLLGVEKCELNALYKQPGSRELSTEKKRLQFTQEELKKKRERRKHELSASVKRTIRATDCCPILPDGDASDTANPSPSYVSGSI